MVMSKVYDLIGILKITITTEYPSAFPLPKAIYSIVWSVISH